MTYISNTQKKYKVKDIVHELDDSINIDTDFFYEYKKKDIDALYDHIKYTVHILNEFIPSKYCCVSGTLLGAIRHKGIIPWDSDADFLVMKNDLLYLKKQLKTINKRNKDYQFIYIPIFCMIKVYYKNHCFIDIFGVNHKPSKSKSNLITYYGPSIHGKDLFISYYIFPTEIYNYKDIFPVIEMPFEDFTINCPNNYIKVLQTNYSKDVLKHIVLPSLSQTHFHDNFFNSTKALPLFKKLQSFYYEYPQLNNYFIVFYIFVSFISFQNYLSYSQKLEYLNYIKTLPENMDIIRICLDIVNFHKNGEIINLCKTIM